LLSTPQTGIDSVLVTYAMLGPLFALYRPVVAFLTGILGGALVRLFGEPQPASAAAEPMPAACTDCNCFADAGVRKLARILDYGFVLLPRDIGKALLVGILIAGVMGALMPADHLKSYLGGGVLSILLLMLAGVPVYVCATASVPIAVGFLHLGASPGAALAFLIAGPATNAATFTALWQALGSRTALLYLVTVAGSALGCGLLLDWLMPRAVAVLPELGKNVGDAEPVSWWAHVWAVLLLIVLVLAYGANRRARNPAAAT
jgi:uncharacterized membrane protein YraQ (UPF0718 family)